MEQAQNKVIRTAIAGLGRSGWSIHAVGMREMPERFRIVAGTDWIGARREEAARELGARASDYWTGMEQP